VAARPLSTTVSRYQRLNLSRRRGNAIRQNLLSGGLIESVPIATRSGQVVLYQLTDYGRSLSPQVGIDPGPPPRASHEHSYWVSRAKRYFENRGYELTVEHAVLGNGTIDLLAERPGERAAVEVETGKSDIKENIEKLREKGFDRVIFVATSPAAVSACQKVLDAIDGLNAPTVELLTWLDVS
jgi:Holliday junction resolvase-like predicted endonuclease